MSTLASVPKQGLCNFSSKILSIGEWNISSHTEKSRSWDPESTWRGGTETKIHMKLRKTKERCKYSQMKPLLCPRNGAVCFMPFHLLNPHNILHWVEEEPRLEMTCLRSHSYLVKEWEFELDLAGPKASLQHPYSAASRALAKITLC